MKKKTTNEVVNKPEESPETMEDSDYMEKQKEPYVKKSDTDELPREDKEDQSEGSQEESEEETNESLNKENRNQSDKVEDELNYLLQKIKKSLVKWP